MKSGRWEACSTLLGSSLLLTAFETGFLGRGEFVVTAGHKRSRRARARSWLVFAVVCGSVLGVGAVAQWVYPGLDGTHDEFLRGLWTRQSAFWPSCVRRDCCRDDARRALRGRNDGEQGDGADARSDKWSDAGDLRDSNTLKPKKGWHHLPITNRRRRSALPESGFWPEWSGYHFVALRGMIHLAEMARHNGLDLYHREIAGRTMKKMFDAPFKLIKPNLEFPRNKDSGGGRILEYATFWEIGYSVYHDSLYLALLSLTGLQRGKQVVAEESGAGETENPISLFNLEPDLPSYRADIYPEQSINLDGNGFAVLRNGTGPGQAIPLSRLRNHGRRTWPSRPAADGILCTRPQLDRRPA